MNWSIPAVSLVVVGLVAFVVGSLVQLATAIGDVRSVAVLALVAVVVAAASVFGARSRGWLANPYW